jgi:Rps23 Pro-64 3,4-dihydroxylase Tpa1-like proline 4-hydroxylase
MNLDKLPHTDLYCATSPFPHCAIDGILETETARAVQTEILAIPNTAWDRYDNPFEQKHTFRDKHSMPPQCAALFAHLESDEVIQALSDMCGIPLMRDDSRNFWGIHKYDHGDKLNIHVDAGMHPDGELKKQLTLGIYLSTEGWTEANAGHLEIWKGSNAASADARLEQCVTKILPAFNRLVLFTCNDYSWHGNPSNVSCLHGEHRVFVTMSYLSRNFTDDNKKKKAFFVPLPGEVESSYMRELRMKRADPVAFKNVYRTSEK